MLRGNVVPFSERYERRGFERGSRIGRELGIKLGIELGIGPDFELSIKQAIVLCIELGIIREFETMPDGHVRTARERFRDEVTEPLAALVRSRQDLCSLAEVADIVIRARTSDELALQLRALLEAGPGNGNLRP
ncbi:MAG: hypothetical protein OXN97_09735 [Bryobacterales bacterium]|nr:hypothetical protein [Bryobacterales bacterium]